MDKSRGRPKTKKGAKKAKRAKRAGGRRPYEEDDLIRALNHPLRRQILRLLHSSRKPLSPTEIEERLELGDDHGGKLSSVSYHATVLARYRTISLVGEQQVRGAMEHFYESRVPASGWVRGVLKRLQKSDEARLWPKGRGPRDRKAPGKEGRQRDGGG